MLSPSESLFLAADGSGNRDPLSDNIQMKGSKFEVSIRFLSSALREQ